jgi:hypothetical protein
LLRAACLIVSFLILAGPFILLLIWSKYLSLNKNSHADILKYQEFEEAK